MHHIMQWNMLLVASANSIDFSFLRVTQAGDLPTWTQEYNNSMYPAELPLTPRKDESFPVGFDFETGCSNRIPREDGAPYPVMPMIHVCSTYGVLCSFYLLNTSQTYVDVCSPPRPLDPTALSLFKVQQQQPQQQMTAAPPVFQTPVKSEMTFTPPLDQSTPALPKLQVSTFNPPVQNLFSLGNMSQPPPQFGVAQVSAPSAFQPTAKPTAPLPVPALTMTQPQKPAQALITVPNTFTPTANQQKPEIVLKQTVEKLSNAEDEKIYNRMIEDELKAFEIELKVIMEKSRALKVNIGTREETAEMRQSLEKLDELKKDATETIESLRTDVQSSRLGLTEMFAMIYEARSRLDNAKTEKSIFIHDNPVQDRTSKRTLDRLVKEVSQCEMQLQTAIEVINSQWSSYKEAIDKRKKNRMHNPSLEGLYQTLTRQQDIIYKQNEKIAGLKSRLGLRDSLMKQNNKTTQNKATESFSDTIISMSLADQVQKENSKLTAKKHNHLLSLLEKREVVTIKPQRPERIGLNSEIIREKKLNAMKSMKRSLPGANVAIPETVPVKTLQPVQKYTMGVSPSAQVAPTQPTPQVPSFGFATPTSSSPAAPPSFGVSISPQGQSSFGVSTKGKVATAPPQSQLSFGSSGTPQAGLSFGITGTQAFGLSSKPAEPTKVAFGGFGVSNNPNLSFGVSQSSDASPKPSFGLSSAPLVLNAEKKREDAASVFGSATNQAPRVYLNPTAHKITPESAKQPTTAENVNVATSVTFSLSNKVAPKEQPKVIEKKQDENKPPAVAVENATYTFKLPGKKDDSAVVSVKAGTGAPNFSSLLANASDSTKPFSMTTSASSPFNSDNKTTETTTTASIFSNFGGSSANSSTSASPFGAAFTGFGSGLSTSFGSDSSKTSTSGFSLNLTSADASKPSVTSSGFSFASLGATINSSAGDVKTTPSLTSLISSKTPPVSSFSFSSALTPQVTSTAAKPIESVSSSTSA